MAAYQTAFFNGISFSISAETIATLPLVVSFVALSTNNYVVRVGGGVPVIRRNPLSPGNTSLRHRNGGGRDC